MSLRCRAQIQPLLSRLHLQSSFPTTSREAIQTHNYFFNIERNHVYTRRAENLEKLHRIFLYKIPLSPQSHSFLLRRKLQVSRLISSHLISFPHPLSLLPRQNHLITSQPMHPAMQCFSKIHRNTFSGILCLFRKLEKLPRKNLHNPIPTRTNHPPPIPAPDHRTDPLSPH
jgi:hypothetical protein